MTHFRNAFCSVLLLSFGGVSQCFAQSYTYPPVVTIDTLVDHLTEPERIKAAKEKAEAALPRLRQKVEDVERGRITGKDSQVSGRRRGTTIYTFRDEASKQQERDRWQKEIDWCDDQINNPIRPPILPIQHLREGAVGILGVNQYGAQRELSAIRILQVVDEENFMADAKGIRIWVTGISTANLTDDALLSIKGRVFVGVGTQRYSTVLGAAKQIDKIRLYDMTAAAEKAAVVLLARTSKPMDSPAAAEAVQFTKEVDREWSSVDGKFTMEATLLSYDNETQKASLKRTDGSSIEIEVSSLSLQDRNYIRSAARDAAK